MSGMSTNKKNEQFIKFMIIFMEDATDIRAALKPCFGGSVKKLKDTLAELGFASAQYSDGSSSEKHPPKIEGSCAKSQPEVVRIIVRKFTLLCTGIEPVIC